MTRSRFFVCDPHSLRRHHNQVYETANKLHRIEADLIALLSECDQHRAYVRLGFKSLKGYCTNGLRFTRVQAQRIVTEVRRVQLVERSPKLETNPYLQPELEMDFEIPDEPTRVHRSIGEVLRCTDVKDWEKGTHLTPK